MPGPTETQHVPKSIGQNSDVSAILATILAVLLVGVAVDTYFQAQRLMDPHHLGDRVETAIRENYPEMHERLVVQVKTQAPQIAEQVSRELIQSTPHMREELEQMAARQLDIGINEVTELSAEQFRELLDDNRETVVAAFEQIEDAPEEAHKLILETEANLEQTLGIDLQRQARNGLKLHRQLNDKLARLNDRDETLDSKELLERRIVRILRTLQIEESDLASLN